MSAVVSANGNFTNVLANTHVLASKLAADPPSQGANRTILYTKDDGAGNIQLKIKMANTSPLVLASRGAGTNQITESFRGLVLMTAAGGSEANTTVILQRADEIVMHTGETIRDWTYLSADISTSGAGGLDTGSEAASTWYEIHAIRKSSDGTRNLLFHKAKNYLADAFQATNDSAQDLRGASTNEKLAQSFSPTVSGKIEIVQIILVKQNTLLNRLWLTLEADSAGRPSGTPLATSDKYNAANITASATDRYLRFVFRNPYTVTSGITYHLVLQGDYAINATNRIQWRYNSAGGYASGKFQQYNGSTWSDIGSADACFQIYVTQNETTPTMPSGYDQRCLIGYVFNDSANNLAGFEAQDKEVFFVGMGTLSTSTTTTTYQLFDINTWIPPRQVMGVFYGGGTVATSGSKLGGGPRGFYDDASGFPFTGALIFWPDAGNAPRMRTEVPIEYQMCYFWVSSGTGGLWIRGYKW